MAFHFNERDLVCNFAKDNTDVPELELDRETQVSLDRQAMEYDSLVLMNSILPGSAPKPYCLDHKHHILAMEDLGDMNMLRKVLEKGDVNMDAAKNLGKLLGIIHRETTRERLSAERWTELNKKFGNEEQIEQYSTWAMQNIFIETDSCTEIAPGVLETYRKCVKLIEPTGYITKVSELFTKKISFIHADCYFEAILIKGTQVALFDFEFAYISHPAMQLGWVVAVYTYLMLKAFKEPGIDVQGLITIYKQAVHEAVKAYLVENDTLKDKEEFLKELALFTGHALFLFTHWVAIDTMVKQTIKHKIWLSECSTQLMLNHEHITTIEQLVEGVFDNVENADA